MITAAQIHSEIADRTRAISPGAIGAIHLRARRLGLVREIDEGPHLLRRHLRYLESDQVLSLASSLLAGGRRPEHLEVRRSDEVSRDALGARRIPDPTTAGDLCRRVPDADVGRLMEILSQTRPRAREPQPEGLLDEASLDADGAIAPSDGRCKRGVDLSDRGGSGDPPPGVSRAKTAEPLVLVNRSGDRPSHPQAEVDLDQAAALGRRAGFKRVTFRGETDFGQTRHPDRRDRAGHRFIVGIAARPDLVALAEGLAPEEYSELERPARYTIETAPRQARERRKQRVVWERQLATWRQLGEEVAGFDYRPVAREPADRVVVLRERLIAEEGRWWRLGPDRLVFSITKDRTTPGSEVVSPANDRGDREDLVAQLKGGVKAWARPVGDRVSSGAGLVMAGRAWSLKAWAARCCPSRGAGRPGIVRRSDRSCGGGPAGSAWRWSRSPARPCGGPGGSSIGGCRGAHGRESL